jgi:hypothetical protein
VPTDEERVAADPALLAEARRRFAGRGDLRDHLWWLAHPGEPTPEGLADPAAAVAEARLDLYRRHGGDRHAAVAEAAAVEQDRALARRAVAETLATAPPVTAPAPVGTRRRGTRAAGPLVAAVVAALVLGAIAGALVTRATAVPPGGPPAALSAPQRDADLIEAAARPAFVDPHSTRLLRTLSTTGTRLYGARDRDGELCLVAVVLGSRSASTCTPEAAFRRDGLRIAVQATADPVDDAGTTPGVDLQAWWTPRGVVRLGSFAPAPTPGA